MLRALFGEEAAGRERSALATRRATAAFLTGKTFEAWQPAASCIPAPTQQARRYRRDRRRRRRSDRRERPGVRSGKQPKRLFAAQAGTRPPRFVLFTSGFLEAGYRRFIERRLREDFGFAGTPIEVSVKVREKGRKR